MGALIVDEHVRVLMERLEELKRQSAALYNRKEEMLTYEKPKLVSLYTKYIGELLFEEFRLKTDLSKVSMTIDLIQSYINRNAVIDIDRVEQDVEHAFEEYNDTIKDHIEAVKAADAYLASPLISPEDIKELTSSYRLIAKKLHPDINPDATEEQKELFIKAVAAYKSFDLPTLRSIVLMLDTDVHKELPKETLQGQIEKVEKTIAEFNARIEQMEASFPFNMSEKIYDEDWVKSEQDRLNASIDALKKSLQDKQQYVAVLKIWKPESLS